MKKKNLIIILIVIIVIISTSVFLISNNRKTNKRIIAESSHINYAWGFKYQGTVICEDGSIYTFDLSDSEEANFDEMSLDKRNELILKNGELTKEKVSRKDLKKLKEYSEKIEQKYETRENGISTRDFGIVSVSIYNYRKDTITMLTQTGDNPMDNVWDGSEEALEVLSKYLSIPEDIDID